MRIIKRLLLVILIIAFLLAVSIKPIIIHSVKKQLAGIFIGSTVKISGCDLIPPHQLILAGIEIDRSPLYHFGVGRISFDFGFSSLLKRNITRVSIEDISVKINSEEQSISDFARKVRMSGSAALVPNSVEISQIELGMKFKEFSVDGKLGGAVKISADYANLSGVDGKFNVLKPGGALTIDDNQYLKNMARSSGNSLDKLMESFKNYHYNNGIIKLSLKDNNIIIDIALDGATGKRNLTVALHDFNLGRVK